MNSEELKELKTYADLDTENYKVSVVCRSLTLCLHYHDVLTQQLQDEIDKELQLYLDTYRKKYKLVDSGKYRFYEACNNHYWEPIMKLEDIK